MKPRLFIGSSVESVNIAYAAQQNLQHNAEVTVWDQGVFKISSTNLESLIRILNTSDFGMFVFSPDDLINIRGEENRAVRDNVILELGLFVGRLGKDRCFILVPDSRGDLHIPADLVGVITAAYETDRSDNSLQAATAPACFGIREAIEKLGTCEEDVGTPNVEPKVYREEAETEVEKPSRTSHAEQPKSVDNSRCDWVDAFAEGKLDEAVGLLEEDIAIAEDDDKRDLIYSWIGRMKYEMDPEIGGEYLRELIKKTPSSSHAYVRLANAHREQQRYDEALSVIDEGLSKVDSKMLLILAKVDCFGELGQDDNVVSTLDYAIDISPKVSDYYLKLASHYIKKENYESAKACLEKGIRVLPNDESILFKYARHIAEHFDNKLALIPYDHLIRLDEKNPRYLALRANIYLELDLHDLAMRDYKKANELASEQQKWILANIGNLYKNRGFYRDGIVYLQRALEIAPEDQYAHERLAIAIKLRDEQEEELKNIVQESRRALASGSSHTESTQVNE